MSVEPPSVLEPARVARRICVVGGAGFVGRALVAELREQGDDAVVIDRDLRGEAGGCVDITARDARAQLARAFEGADAVVHLAARVNPATHAEREQMRRLHVDGTEAVVRAMREAGVRRLVLASSATVYGAWPDNPVPLDEDARTRPNPGFWYGEDKLTQEHIVAAGGVDHVIARPAIVYGQGAKSYLTEILRLAPVLPALDGHRPPLQMVHVDDVARALAFLVGLDAAALEKDRVFNVAPTDWLTFDEVAAVAARRVVPVPLALTRGFDALARVLPPHLRAPRAMLPYLMFSFVLTSARLCALGWAPRWRSADALRSIL